MHICRAKHVRVLYFLRYLSPCVCSRAYRDPNMRPLHLILEPFYERRDCKFGSTVEMTAGVVGVLLVANTAKVTQNIMLYNKIHLNLFHRTTRKAIHISHACG